MNSPWPALSLLISLMIPDIHNLDPFISILDANNFYTVFLIKNLEIRELCIIFVKIEEL